MKHFTKGTVPDLAFKKAKKKPIAIRCAKIDEAFDVQTMEGLMQGKAGDWLIVGVNDEMYLIDDEIFHKTYDLV